MVYISGMILFTHEVERDLPNARDLVWKLTCDDSKHFEFESEQWENAMIDLLATDVFKQLPKNAQIKTILFNFNLTHATLYNRNSL